MSNEIKGAISKIMPKESGTNKQGKGWERQSFLLAFKDGNFDKQLLLTCMKPEILNGRGTGEQVTVNYSCESREFNGKYYTNCNAFKIS